MKGWMLGGVAGLGLLGLTALVVVVVRSGTKVDRTEECRFHMMRMWNSVNGAEVSSSKAWDDEAKGRDFWILSNQWPSARIPLDPNDLRCPVLGSDQGVDYRGPARSLRTLKPDEPMAADRVGNHPVRGNVLLKNGEILEADERLWARANETTCD